MIELAPIHNIIKARTQIPIVRIGQAYTEKRRPYCAYSTINTPAPTQSTVKKSGIIGAGPGTSYRRTDRVRVQYSYIFKGTDKTYIDKLNDLERFFHEKEFLESMRDINMAFLLDGGIQESNIDIDEFTDRQFVHFVEYWKFDEWTTEGGEFIETVTPEIVDPPSEL